MLAEIGLENVDGEKEVTEVSMPSQKRGLTRTWFLKPIGIPLGMTL